jgi:hypothetical protein
MRRQVIELERLDVGERAGRREAGNVRNGGVRAEIEDNLVAGERVNAPVVQGDLDGPRADEASAPYDELGAAVLADVERSRVRRCPACG